MLIVSDNNEYGWFALSNVGGAHRASFLGQDSGVAGSIGLNANDSGELSLYHPTSEKSIHLEFRKNGSPIISLSSSNGKPLLGITLNQDDMPRILLFKPDSNKAAMRIALTSDGLPTISLMDKEGRNRLQLGVDESGTGFIRGLDENGATEWERP
jgi:hypothetical protein